MGCKVNAVPIQQHGIGGVEHKNFSFVAIMFMEKPLSSHEGKHIWTKLSDFYTLAQNKRESKTLLTWQYTNHPIV